MFIWTYRGIDGGSWNSNGSRGGSCGCGDNKVLASNVRVGTYKKGTLSGWTDKLIIDEQSDEYRVSIPLSELQNLKESKEISFTDGMGKTLKWASFNPTGEYTLFLPKDVVVPRGVQLGAYAELLYDKPEGLKSGKEILQIFLFLEHRRNLEIILPVIQRENAKRAPKAFRDVAKALGYATEGKTDEECAAYAIAEIERLSEVVGIPKKLTELNITEEEFDFEYLSKNALVDACTPGNPFPPTLEETIAFYKELF